VTDEKAANDAKKNIAKKAEEAKMTKKQRKLQAQMKIFDLKM